MLEGYYPSRLDMLPKLKTLYVNSFISITRTISELPESLTHLVLNSNYNNVFNIDVLQNLTWLELGGDFNRPVDFLSNLTNLTNLQFGLKFNNPVDNLP